MTQKFPEYVIVCPVCEGKGQTRQTYVVGCGGGYYDSMGPCQVCGQNQPYEGPGFVYKNTYEPVSESVLAQIKEMNR